MRPPDSGSFPIPPSGGLRDRLLEQAAALEAGGHDGPASELRVAIERWWADEQAWLGHLAGALGMHHEINNALVGVRGNAQLLMMGPVGQQSGVRERLEVVLRESGRIQNAAARLQELKSSLAPMGRGARAA